MCQYENSVYRLQYIVAGVVWFAVNMYTNIWSSVSVQILQVPNNIRPFCLESIVKFMAKYQVKFESHTVDKPLVFLLLYSCTALYLSASTYRGWIQEMARGGAQTG